MMKRKKPEPEPVIYGHHYSEYLAMVEAFHGYPAPGVVLGGFMVDLAYRRLHACGCFDALCETRACLPDAVQILTPCTIGNGWLKIIDLGRFALTLYEKYEGRGVRVFVDPLKMEPFPALKGWFLKLKSKKDQDHDSIMNEIRLAGSIVCRAEKVRVAPAHMKAASRKGFTVCPSCHETYPSQHGGLCRGCQGKAPYLKNLSGSPTQ